MKVLQASVISRSAQGSFGIGLGQFLVPPWYRTRFLWCTFASVTLRATLRNAQEADLYGPSDEVASGGDTELLP